MEDILTKIQEFANFNLEDTLKYVEEVPNDIILLMKL